MALEIRRRVAERFRLRLAVDFGEGDAVDIHLSRRENALLGILLA